MREILFIDKKADKHITHDREIFIPQGERALVSFIGKSPANVKVEGNLSKVWEVVRCGAKYHHNGICEEVTEENATEFYCDFYGIEIVSGTVILYKRVKEDYSDYYSGEYSYLPRTIVTAKDWEQNRKIVCGNGLHLCATIAQSEQWNEGGRILECLVSLRDMVVFPYNISQVRCREVFVKGDVEEDHVKIDV